MLVVWKIEELGGEDIAVRSRDSSLVGGRETSQLLLETPCAALVHDLSEKLLDVAQEDVVERTCFCGWDRQQVVRPTMAPPPREGDPLHVLPVLLELFSKGMAGIVDDELEAGLGFAVVKATRA